MFGCPSDPDNLAERFCMGRLDDEEAYAFMAHVDVCSSCREVFETNMEFIDTIRKSARGSNEDMPATFRLRWIW
jgi:hypothetical protein